MIRAFVACELAAQVLAALREAQEELRAAGGDVRWVSPRGLHITLKFLGGVPEADLPALGEALRGAASASRGCRAEVRGVGGFPNLGRARVLWAGVEGKNVDELAVAARRVDDAVRPFGIPAEQRPFHPHVTLGRVRSSRGWAAVEQCARGLAARSFGEADLEEAVLYRSELGRDGAVYTPLERFPFGLCEKPRPQMWGSET